MYFCCELNEIGSGLHGSSGDDAREISTLTFTRLFIIDSDQRDLNGETIRDCTCQNLSIKNPYAEILFFQI